ncbi:MAG TPA: hypothetical protein VJY62_08995 [Bacteroidia bacterium]|nr:hypothetical protein [Bacteroidia bacterium]
MNLHTLKLSLIDWLIHLKDENLINEVQSIRKKEFVKRYESSLKPFSEEEFKERVMAAEEDIKYGKVTSFDDYLKESENW